MTMKRKASTGYCLPSSPKTNRPSSGYLLDIVVLSLQRSMAYRPSLRYASCFLQSIHPTPSSRPLFLSSGSGNITPSSHKAWVTPTYPRVTGCIVLCKRSLCRTRTIVEDEESQCLLSKVVSVVVTIQISAFLDRLLREIPYPLLLLRLCL